MHVRCGGVFERIERNPRVVKLRYHFVGFDTQLHPELLSVDVCETVRYRVGSQLVQGQTKVVDLRLRKTVGVSKAGYCLSQLP